MNDSQPMSLSPGSQLNNVQINHFGAKNDKRQIEEIPFKYRNIFDFPSFNVLQSKVMNDVLYSDEPLVITAPTGSGKTVIFELAIIRLLQIKENKNLKNDLKIVYMAPIKALCGERYEDWKKKFSPFGIKCQEVTGDVNELEYNSLPNCNIIFTTPEKWDSLTRKWRDNKKLISMIKLFLIDEVHLLNDDKRGPILEAVITRMKTIRICLKSNRKNNDLSSIELRFLAISATFPNVEDIAQWLGNCEDVPAKYIKLDEGFRPVKLKKVVLGFPFSGNKGIFQFEIMLSYKLRQILIDYAEGKPTLIFCSTRKGVIQTCDILIKQITFQMNDSQKKRLKETATFLKELKLKEYLVSGVGYHHAGMQVEDRRSIEDIFRMGLLPVLVTTSTLAMGVNLPAHLVIIKSTSQYISGSIQDLNEIQLLQMIGRAGRPQYDTSGTAVILTRDKDKEKYERIVNSQDMIESSLHKHLIEHLNAEIVLLTINEKAIAMNWIRSTYLYVRAMKNPSYYGFKANISKKEIENRLQEICLKEMEALENTDLIEMDILDVRPTPVGKLMSRYYLSFETMKKFTLLSGSENIPQMLEVISTCQEFNEVQLRVNEKRFLNQLNKSKHSDIIKYPFKGAIKTKEMKVNCLIQAAFGNITIPDFSLQQEANKILRIGERISSCLTQYLYLKKCYLNLLSALILAKCFHCKLWEDSPYISRQLPKIGATYSTLLAGAGKTTFEKIIDSNPRDLERILNKPPPFGNLLREYAQQIPVYELNLELLLHKKIQVKVFIKNVKEINAQNTNWLNILVGDPSGILLLKDRFNDNILFNTGSHTWIIDIKEFENIERVNADLICEDWAGVDQKATLNLNSGINKFKLDLKRFKQTDEKQLSLSKKSKVHEEIKKFTNSFPNTPSKRFSIKCDLESNIYFKDKLPHKVSDEIPSKKIRKNEEDKWISENQRNNNKEINTIDINDILEKSDLSENNEFQEKSESLYSENEINEQSYLNEDFETYFDDPVEKKTNFQKNENPEINVFNDLLFENDSNFLFKNSEEENNAEFRNQNDFLNSDGRENCLKSQETYYSSLEYLSHLSFENSFEIDEIVEETDRKNCKKNYQETRSFFSNIAYKMYENKIQFIKEINISRQVTRYFLEKCEMKLKNQIVIDVHKRIQSLNYNRNENLRKSEEKIYIQKLMNDFYTNIEFIVILNLFLEKLLRKKNFQGECQKTIEEIDQIKNLINILRNKNKFIKDECRNFKEKYNHKRINSNELILIKKELEENAKIEKINFINKEDSNENEYINEENDILKSTNFEAEMACIGPLMNLLYLEPEPREANLNNILVKSFMHSENDEPYIQMNLSLIENNKFDLNNFIEEDIFNFNESESDNVKPFDNLWNDNNEENKVFPNSFNEVFPNNNYEDTQYESNILENLENSLGLTFNENKDNFVQQNKINSDFFSDYKNQTIGQMKRNYVEKTKVQLFPYLKKRKF